MPPSAEFHTYRQQVLEARAKTVRAKKRDFTHMRIEQPTHPRLLAFFCGSVALVLVLGGAPLIAKGWSVGADNLPSLEAQAGTLTPDAFGATAPATSD